MRPSRLGKRLSSLAVASLFGAGLAGALGRAWASGGVSGSDAPPAKAVACAACHSPGAPSDAPYLGGQTASYLSKELTTFQHGDRVHSMMSAITHQLNEADIAELATYWSQQRAGAALFSADQLASITRPRMAFPQGFPAGFTRYRTSNNADQGSVNSLYINAVGLAAARAGKDLPDGTIIMMANYAAKRGADGKPITTRDGSWQTDKLVSYLGMELRAGGGSSIPELLRNGDWRYNQFGPDQAPKRDVNHAECLACHKAQAAVSYVFSFQELRELSGLP
jgi:cytochrome c553